MTNAKVLLALGVAAILGTCGPRPVEPIIDRPAQVVRVYTDGKTPYYVECAEKGRRLLRQGRLGEAEAWLSCAAHSGFFEVPNYESWLELAEVKCRVGKLDEANTWIDDFEMALRVDFGETPCFSAPRRAGEEVPNSDMSERVFSELCSVFVELYDLQYVSAAERQEIESKRMRFERESLTLRALCPFLTD